MEMTIASILETTKKTQKSLINEVCAKKKLPPPTWRTDMLPLTPPKFKSVCSVTASTVGALSQAAEGFGSSKKEAEHKAAAELLKLLVNTTELYEISGAAKLQTRSNGDDVDDDPVSDTDDDAIRGEPIGELITLCLRHALPMAEVKENVKRGPGNIMIFSVTCSIKGLSCHSGRRIKKQDAKKVGAFRVLRELKEKGFSSEKAKPKSHAALTAVIQQIQVEAEVSSSIDVEIMELDGGTNNNTTVSVSDEEVMKIVNTREEKNTPGVMIVETEEPQPGPSREITSGNEDNENTLEDIEVESLIKSVKRKLGKEDEFQVHPEKIRKSELILGSTFVCPEMSENSLKFIKDYWHVFQHLPSSAELDEALVNQDYVNNLYKAVGGPIPFLEKAGKELDLKWTFTHTFRSSSDEELIFLRIRIPEKYQNWNQQQDLLVVSGCGSTPEAAKEKAALEALKTIWCMLFNYIDNKNTLSQKQ